ncbi:hypothetical protein [Salinisphaera sp. G21_0]|uniref:hypothetical protein n=1 Tax=Salinisphaera sp. G21_0 TaxID=2821094 RepID=UPI001ADD4521|nr:hypothetical protein [Salinisphaera sp. G21_0]MBO9483180.1 hypothetical protein [Salinisphaera sp. G21_0]
MKTGDAMNIGNMATGLAGVGLAAAVSLSTDVANSSILKKWRTRAVMALSSTLGTSLSLVQCIREGRNISTRTLATLATNAGVLAYSYLQPWADDFKHDLLAIESIWKKKCLKDYWTYGEMPSPICDRFLDNVEVIEWKKEQVTGKSYKLQKVTWTRFG